MDRPSVLVAAGIPVRFQPAGGGPAGLPRTGQHLLADEMAGQTGGAADPAGGIVRA